MSESYNLNVSVEQRHIDAGIGHLCQNCPVALAINDCLKPEYYAAVGKERRNVISIEFSDRNITQYMTTMDDKVVNFINSFDAGKIVAPFVFTLPNVSERMIKAL